VVSRREPAIRRRDGKRNVGQAFWKKCFTAGSSTIRNGIPVASHISAKSSSSSPWE
ncbi:hypothetical protein F441_04331, partial [Phytophthora nicotianae CJ01A1]